MSAVAALPKVAVLGANGQVGTELCIYLAISGFCQPIAITRSAVSTGLLSRAGISCRVGDLAEDAVARRLLKDCDLVFDLALPSGQNPAETKEMIRRRMRSLISAMDDSKTFVLASTTSVYRSTPFQPFFRTYRSTKLLSERVARSLGSEHGVSVFIFRLGQVHGVLQSCSQSIRRRLTERPLEIRVPDQSSNAVFIHCIAEALREVLTRNVRPDVYTVISQPPWSYTELLLHYAEGLGIEPLSIVKESARLPSACDVALRAVRGWANIGASSLANHYRELLSSAASAGSKEMEQALRFRRTSRIARAKIESYFASLSYRPFEPMYELPGTRFPFSGTPRAGIGRSENSVREAIRGLVDR